MDTTHAEHIADHARGHIPVSVRRMFGCCGLFGPAGMFALVDPEGGLFVKRGLRNADVLAEQGCPPFSYQAKGRWVDLSYFRVPEEVVEDGGQLEAWLLAAQPERGTSRPGRDETPEDFGWR